LDTKVRNVGQPPAPFHGPHCTRLPRPVDSQRAPGTETRQRLRRVLYCRDRGGM